MRLPILPISATIVVMTAVAVAVAVVVMVRVAALVCWNCIVAMAIIP